MGILRYFCHCSADKLALGIMSVKPDNEAVDNLNWDEVNLTLILIIVVLVRMNMCILILTQHHNYLIKIYFQHNVHVV